MPRKQAGLKRWRIVIPVVIEVDATNEDKAEDVAVDLLLDADVGGTGDILDVHAASDVEEVVR